MRYTQADRLEKLGTQKFVYAQPLDSFARINIVLAVVIVVVTIIIYNNPIFVFITITILIFYFNFFPCQ